MTRRTVTVRRSAKGDHVTVVMDGDRLVSVKAHGPMFRASAQNGRPAALFQKRDIRDHALPTWAPSRVSTAGRAAAERANRKDTEA